MCVTQFDYHQIAPILEVSCTFPGVDIQNWDLNFLKFNKWYMGRVRQATKLYNRIRSKYCVYMQHNSVRAKLIGTSLPMLH